MPLVQVLLTTPDHLWNHRKLISHKHRLSQLIKDHNYMPHWGWNVQIRLLHTVTGIFLKFFSATFNYVLLSESFSSVWLIPVQTNKTKKGINLNNTWNLQHWSEVLHSWWKPVTIVLKEKYHKKSHSKNTWSILKKIPQ